MLFVRRDVLCLILLFRNAGLACVTITGWAKGVDYRPGVAITSQPLNHSWNAVYIDGDWQLVDSHWGTRFLQSESNVAENLVYEFDDFYFLTEPVQLAYTHRPQDSVWQLLSQPQSADKFEDYPLVKSYFFTNQMHLLPNQNHGVVCAKKGEDSLLRVILPSFLADTTRLSSSARSQLSPEWRHLSLVHFFSNLSLWDLVI